MEQFKYFLITALTMTNLFCSAMAQSGTLTNKKVRFTNKSGSDIYVLFGGSMPSKATSFTPSSSFGAYIPKDGLPVEVSFPFNYTVGLNAEWVNKTVMISHRGLEILTRLGGKAVPTSQEELENLKKYTNPINISQSLFNDPLSTLKNATELAAKQIPGFYVADLKDMIIEGGQRTPLKIGDIETFAEAGLVSKVDR